MSVISPVIASSGSTLRPVSSDAIDVESETPADGPSFGIAPAGMWMCKSCLANQSSGSPSSEERERRNEIAAVADSFITSPSWPVSVSLPVPGIAVVSMNRMSPPTGVYARPVATPTDAVRRFTSL